MHAIPNHTQSISAAEGAAKRSDSADARLSLDDVHSGFQRRAPGFLPQRSSLFFSLIRRYFAAAYWVARGRPEIASDYLRDARFFAKRER